MNLKSNSHSGMTLVELVVGMALLAIITLALGSLVAYQADQSGKAKAAAGVTEQISEFAQVLEVYLTNATHIYSCNCNTDNLNQNCLYNESSLACSTGPCAVLDFETEISDSPDTEGTPLASGLIPRGNKRRYELYYTPPTPATDSGDIGAPGKLELKDKTTSTVLFFANQVTQFVCGQLSSSSAAKLSWSNFNYQIQMKAQLSTLKHATDKSLLDGWHPNDPGFFRGIHRTLSSQVTFRNIKFQGIYFGRTLTQKNCERDPTQTVVATDANCCSGYYDPATEKCIPADQCSPAGTDVQGQWTKCCSHKVMGQRCS